LGIQFMIGVNRIYDVSHNRMTPRKGSQPQLALIALSRLVYLVGMVYLLCIIMLTHTQLTYGTVLYVYAWTV
jgi:hypothetical protein